MDHEAERIRYRDLVAKQKTAIKELIKLSDNHPGLFEYETIIKLQNCGEKCDKLYDKLDKDEFEIAIVGLEKAGKSTFANALMGNNILPEADKRCTYTSTCIRYGAEDRAVVKFHSMSEMDNIVRGYLAALGVSNPDSYTYSSLSQSIYSSLYSQLPENTQREEKNKMNKDMENLLGSNNKRSLNQLIGKPDKIFEGDSFREQAELLKKFIIEPSMSLAVKSVTIESSKLSKMKNAVIYDVPGFDSPTNFHREQTKERMKEADAIMMIAAAHKPSFTGPSLDIFQDVVDEDNVYLSDKLFIFGNRADDANSLAENIAVIKEEALSNNMLKPSQIDERVMVGSAKAHLQKLGVITVGPDDDNLVEKLQREKFRTALPHGDGIEYAYDKLVEYNRNERFPILVKKILKNNELLRVILTDLEKKYNNGYTLDLTAVLAKNTELIRQTRDKIIDGLEQLRLDIREKYSECILSQKLQDEISKLFDGNIYEITEEDIKDEILKSSGVGRVNDAATADAHIRERKFESIYNDFSDAAFGVAQKDHSEYYGKIVECFENAFGQGKNADIHSMVTDFIGKYRTEVEDNFIYQPLIERFVRDLVEVLIKYSYESDARCNKFISEAELFSGLILFYNPGDANTGYKNQFLAVSAKNQPLLLALLFHDYKEAAASTKQAMDVMNRIFNGLCENPEIIQLVFSIIKFDPAGGVKAISSLAGKLGGKKSNDSDVIGNLRTIRGQIEPGNVEKHNFDFSNPEKFRQKYKHYFGETKMVETDDLCEFFNEDLEILRDFLIHASIPAIKLEKPFVAREIQSINKLIEAVNSPEFGDMISSNNKLLLSDVVADMERDAENAQANKLAVAQAKEILKELDSFKTA